ncbi:MAG TPA: response regulator [Steroidobacteraceae bacterium]
MAKQKLRKTGKAAQIAEAAKGIKTILVIDDASLVRLYYRSALEAAGFKVEEAMNGIEALEKLLEKPVDLLIVDVNMPQMDGFTFLRLLRQRDTAIASIPALITSTESGQKDFEAGREAGANYYLVKPISPEAMVEFALMFCGLPP